MVQTGRPNPGKIFKIKSKDNLPEIEPEGIDALKMALLTSRFPILLNWVFRRRIDIR